MIPCDTESACDDDFVPQFIMVVNDTMINCVTISPLEDDFAARIITTERLIRRIGDAGAIRLTMASKPEHPCSPKNETPH